jgi:hypothetical protein
MKDFSGHRRNQRLKKEELIEVLARLEHERWIEWSMEIAHQLKDLTTALQGYRDISCGKEPSEEWKGLVRDGDEFGGQILIFEVNERLNRWNLLHQTPYADLDESQKERIRQHAKRTYEVLK